MCVVCTCGHYFFFFPSASCVFPCVRICVSAPPPPSPVDKAGLEPSQLLHKRLAADDDFV